MCSSWVPLSSIRNWSGEEQGANSAPFSEHSNVDPAWSASKTKVAASDVPGIAGDWPSTICPAGPVVIVVTGAGTTVQVSTAGVSASRLPARSTARIRSSWAPGSRPVTVTGDSHAANGSPSTEHSKLSIRTGVALSVPKNATTASVSCPMVAGRPAPEMPVPGGVVSATLAQVYVAGVGSTLPSNSGLFGSGNAGSTASIARTSKVCSPGAISGSS